MEILLKNNHSQLENLVSNMAKYQKVLLLYDNSTSHIDIAETFSCIKEICIFNKMHLNNIDENELFNGYKMLIFLCSGISIVNLKFNRDEFINVYIVTDNNLLPCFSNNNMLLTANSYLLLNKASLDINLLSSFYFNNFIHYVENLFNFNHCYFKENITNEVTLYNVLDAINKITENYEFVDINIVQQTNINYEDISLVQLILVDAFLIFITNIKNRQADLIDVYKVAKNNHELVDKFYAYYNNDSVLNSIILNYNSLSTITINTKKKILQNISLNNNINPNNINKIINATKEYLKNSNSFLTYLYLFNIFGN